MPSGAPRMPVAFESKTRYRPSLLIQGRKASPPPPRAARATMFVDPTGPQFTLGFGGMVVVVVPGSPPPGRVVSVPPPPGLVVPPAVFRGAAAMPTIALLSFTAPVEPKKVASPKEKIP